MGTVWDLARFTSSITVLGWLISPLITLFLPKILSGLGFDASKKLDDLKLDAIPELKKTLQAVDEARMLERWRAGKMDADVVASLDKMAAKLRHAWHEADDILSLVDYHQIERKVVGNRSSWTYFLCWFRRRLSDEPPRMITDATFDEPVPVASIAAPSNSLGWWLSCWNGPFDFNVGSGLAWLLECVQKKSSSCWLLRRPEDILPVSAAPSSHETSSAAPDDILPVTTSGRPSGEPVPEATPGASSEKSVPVTSAASSDSSAWWLSCLRSTFVDLFKNYGPIQINRTYKNWSYGVLGITSYLENDTAIDYVFSCASRWNLRKRIEKVGGAITEVKKSSLVPQGAASKSPIDDIANKYRSKIRTASMRKVFGREMLRDDIMAKLREKPHVDAASSNTSTCYSVVGIYGVAGSGKTTFARYIRDYIEEECKDNIFDTIMCIHVSENFSVDDIFHEMLKDIIKVRQSNISDHDDLKEKLKESLSGKCFFLILDDLWGDNKNDPQLQELLSPLNVGKEGSKILVTARRKDAARALCADEPIKLPDLAEAEYLSMFMHYALDGKSVAKEEFKAVGEVIAKKLHGSPIAAVTVAGHLGANTDIKFWENTARLDMLTDTMGALWWSYQQLNADIRRCFEYCSIFPRRFKLKRDELVHMWIAQGFVKTSRATQDMEDVAHNYVDELLSCSFLEPGGPEFLGGEDYYLVHDLLHDLAQRVAGNDCLRIENERSQRGEGWKGDIPRDVCHLFVQNYDGELITEKIIKLKNLRTLIVYSVGEVKPEEKVIKGIFKRLPKLRVLAIALSREWDAPIGKRGDMFSIPESISPLKHLRYFAFRTNFTCSIIFPAVTKLYHLQLLDVGNCQKLFPPADLVNLRHLFCPAYMECPNIGELISLQNIRRFRVKKEQGYEVKQLRDLNKLRGSLQITCLENVKSKEEAVEANIAAKKDLGYLSLVWSARSSPEVQAEVLEGLCPPVGLQTLSINGYDGLRYPSWMVGRQNGRPKDLRKLVFIMGWQLGPSPELDAFNHLRSLKLSFCYWVALPGNMEHLTSLKSLKIDNCRSIRSLPTLPLSLEKFALHDCCVSLTRSCLTIGDPNWEKIQHIRKKVIGYGSRPSKFLEECNQRLTRSLKQFLKMRRDNTKGSQTNPDEDGEIQRGNAEREVMGISDDLGDIYSELKGVLENESVRTGVSCYLQVLSRLLNVQISTVSLGLSIPDQDMQTGSDGGQSSS